jgi:hypothetical protein
MTAAPIVFVMIAFGYVRKRNRLGWWWMLGAILCLAVAWWLHAA